MANTTNPYTDFMDPDFPLLARLRESAPGTYKHSQNVMNICEAIATELDLNKDLLRVASLFHDVGKTFNPEGFIENQNEYNPHDELPPETSYEIITRHVSDSCLLLAQYGFPVEVIQTISTHHGNSVVLFFWKKSGDDDGTKDQFRYKSSIPQDVESSVLMICDRVEAQAKSWYNAGKMSNAEAREQVIEDAINDLIDDDQIDNLKIGVLKVVKRVLKIELQALYHDRVDYDKNSTPSKSKKTETKEK